MSKWQFLRFDVPKWLNSSSRNFSELWEIFEFWYCVKRDLRKRKKSIDLKVSSTEIVRRKWRKFKMIAPALQYLWSKHSSIDFILFAILWIKNCRIIDFRVQDTILLFIEFSMKIIITLINLKSWHFIRNCLYLRHCTR